MKDYIIIEEYGNMDIIEILKTYWQECDYDE